MVNLPTLVENPDGLKRARGVCLTQQFQEQI